MKLQWTREWVDITTQSLEAWKVRDEQSVFLPDNRRGYARVTPIALSKLGVPGSAYDENLGHACSDWTTKTVQPAHIDSALQAMIDQS